MGAGKKRWEDFPETMTTVDLLREFFWTLLSGIIYIEKRKGR